METQYDYSSTQINIPEPLAEEIQKWGKDSIPDEALHSDDGDDAFDGMGREEIIHCTVLYGIHDADPKKASDAVKDCGPVTLALGKVSVFKTNPDYHVVKLTVDGKSLHELHDTLKKKVPNSFKWPKYQPHITIAYVKPGEADHLEGNDTFEGREVLAQGVLFCSKDGLKVTLHLGDANMGKSRAFVGGFAMELEKRASLGRT